MKTKFLSVLAITAILFVSCGSDDEVTTEVNDGRVLFSSGVNAATPKVNAGGDQWNRDDVIGIYMVNKGTTTVAEGADNIAYINLLSTSYSATFTSVNGSKAIYYPVNIDQKVEFISYHPYNASVSNYVYPIDLTTQTSQTALDLMVAQKADNAGAGYDKTNQSPVSLVFDHQLVKIYLQVTKDASVNGSTVDINIKGMNTTADFDITNLSTGLTNEDNIADITPERVGNSDAHFYATLLPVATLDNSHIIEFTTGGNTYKWTINDAANNLNNVTSLDKGKFYTFKVKLQKNKVTVTGSINSWEPAGAATEGTAN